ncbi:ADPribosylglycohydrolase superfamily protein [Pelomyxa schiedti]|nr:ADPribosylglycohydrolase superfamily protein [Pelomyxa schiedti]
MAVIPSLLRLLAHRWVMNPDGLYAFTLWDNGGSCSTRQLWVRVSHTLGVVDSGWFFFTGTQNEGIFAVGAIGLDSIVSICQDTVYVVGIDGTHQMSYCTDRARMKVCCNSKWLVVVKWESQLLIWSVGTQGGHTAFSSHPHLAIAGKAVEKAKFTKESDDVLMLLCKHRSTFLYSIVSGDVPASLKRSSLVTLREVEFPSDMTRRVDGFLMSNGMLWVVLYELFADVYKLRCVNSGEYCTFSGGGKIRTMGCEHFCVFNKTSSSGTVYIASNPPQAVFSFENPCYDPHMQLQSWNMGILATGESRPPGSPIASVVVQNAFHGLTQASLKFPSRFTLTEGCVEPKRDCPHLVAHYAPLDSNDTSTLDGVMTRKCFMCAETHENWLCVKCYTIGCSRHVQGHLKEHHFTSGHCIAVSFMDLSFWCYLCDSYIIHPTLLPLYNKLHIAKFGCEPGKASVTKDDLAGVFEELQKDRTEVKIATPAVPPTYEISGIDPAISASPIVDKILGCIYGNALGDAYGLATEFCTKEWVNEKFHGSQIPFPDFPRTAHSVRWTLGDWTDDTDQLILILQGILETGGTVSETNFAMKLIHWIKQGFPELGDTAGLGLGGTVARTAFKTTFLLDPHESARQTWLELNKNAAANGAVMRTAILGVHQFRSLPNVMANTATIARATHWDPRCVASSVIVCLCIAMILQGRSVATKAEATALVTEAINRTVEFLGDDLIPQHREELMRTALTENIADLSLDNKHGMGYTFKTLGAASWALRNMGSTFQDNICPVVNEAGDADTNAAVAGALVGCRLGYSHLPREWLVAMPHKAWLDKQIVAFLNTICKTDILS